MRNFKVFSADWEVEVKAKSFVEAMLIGTEQAYEAQGESFSVGYCVAVVNQKTQETEVYSSVAVLEDLHKYYLAKELAKFLKWLKL